MEELKSYLETIIALEIQHIERDKAWEHDPIDGRFNQGRIAVENAHLDIFKKIADMVNKL